jgi:hypothetical protein
MEEMMLLMRKSEEFVQYNVRSASYVEKHNIRDAKLRKAKRKFDAGLYGKYATYDIRDDERSQKSSCNDSHIWNPIHTGNYHRIDYPFVERRHQTLADLASKGLRESPCEKNSNSRGISDCVDDYSSHCWGKEVSKNGWL